MVRESFVSVYLSRDEVNKVENCADIWVKGFLGRGKSNCIDFVVGICLVGLRIASG